MKEPNQDFVMDLVNHPNYINPWTGTHVLQSTNSGPYVMKLSITQLLLDNFMDPLIFEDQLSQTYHKVYVMLLALPFPQAPLKIMYLSPQCTSILIFSLKDETSNNWSPLGTSAIESSMSSPFLDKCYLRYSKRWESWFGSFRLCGRSGKTSHKQELASFNQLFWDLTRWHFLIF